MNPYNNQFNSYNTGDSNYNVLFSNNYNTNGKQFVTNNIQDEHGAVEKEEMDNLELEMGNTYVSYPSAKDRMMEAEIIYKHIYPYNYNYEGTESPPTFISKMNSYIPSFLFTKNKIPSEKKNITHANIANNIPFPSIYPSVEIPIENKNIGPIVVNNNLHTPSAPPIELFDDISNVNNVKPEEEKPIVESPKIIVVKEALVERIKLTADSNHIPIFSYVDLAFSEELKDANTYEEVCKRLPKHALRDVLRHLSRYSIIQGKVEKMIEKYNNEEIKAGRYDLINVKDEIQKINPRQFILQPVGISQELLAKGETILKTHYELPVRMYSGNKEICESHNKKCAEADEKYHVAFTNYINEIKGTSLFFKYVYEQAKVANVHIEDWDKQFAEYNWNKKGMHLLSVQALERCLHGQK